jgi:HK97 family phage major capsid protein
MANAIPLLEGTSTSGGTLITPASYGQTLVNGLLRKSAALNLSRVQRVNTNAAKFSVYAGRPTAAFVSEAAAKPATGAEYTEMTINIKKMATIVMYTEELLEDAREDPSVLVNQDVIQAFDYLIDAHILGYSAGSQITTSFDGALRASTSTVEYAQASADGLALAISNAMGTVEAAGYNPTGVILPNDAKVAMRNARDTTTRPLYTDGFVRDGENGLYGLNFAYSTNLPTLAGTAGAGRVVGIVGDFDHALAAIRSDLSVAFSDQATVDVSGTLHHLWQQNKRAARWEMRMGFNTHDVNNAFCLILNAA